MKPQVIKVTDTKELVETSDEDDPYSEQQDDEPQE
jgi:hypothetical protein